MTDISVTYSVCIGYYKGIERIKRLLRSIFAYPPDEPWELCVTGSDLKDWEYKYLQFLFQWSQDKNITLGGLTPFSSYWHNSGCVGVEWVYIPRRMPNSINQNVNVTMARGKYVVVCDDDAEVLHPATFQRLRRAIEEEGAIAASCCCRDPNLPEPQRVPLDWEPDEHIGERVEGDSINGFFWMTPRIAWDASRVGLYNTFGWVWADDADWSQRAVHVMGYKVVFCKDVVVGHKCHWPNPKTNPERTADIMHTILNYQRWARLGLLGPARTTDGLWVNVPTSTNAADAESRSQPPRPTASTPPDPPAADSPPSDTSAEHTPQATDREP